MEQRKKEFNWACTLVMYFGHVFWAYPDSPFEKSFAKHPSMSDRFLLKLFVFDIFPALKKTIEVLAFSISAGFNSV